MKIEVKLCEMNDHEFETGSDLDKAVKRAGYGVNPRVLVGQLGMWNATLDEFLDFLKSTSGAEHEE